MADTPKLDAMISPDMHRMQRAQKKLKVTNHYLDGVKAKSALREQKMQEQGAAHLSAHLERSI